MNFNRHSNLEGQHAFLGASKYHWINYTDDKIADSYVRFLATQKGTVLHAFAAQCILLGQKLPKSQKTLNMYVNDAIGYEDLDEYIVACGYDVRCFGYDPYNAKEFVERWAAENGPFGIEKVIQGAKTESVPLGELKKLAEDRMLLFDEELMTYAMGNCIAMEDTNGNRKLMKKRYEQKIDAVSAMMDAYIAYKRNPEAFE